MADPIRASGADIDAPIPTRRTLFLRRFFPYQAVRFLFVNLRMLRMIRLSHPHHLPPVGG